MSEALRVRRPHTRAEGAHAAAAPARAPAAAVPGPASPAASGWAAAPGPPALLLGVQRKPVIGQPGDAYEIEADAVADRVAGGLAAPGERVSRLGPGGPPRAKEHDDPPAATENDALPPIQAKDGDDDQPFPARAMDEGGSSAIQAKDAGVESFQADGENPYGALQRARRREAESSPSVRPEHGTQRAAVRRMAPGDAAATPSMADAAAAAVAAPGAGSALPAGTRGALEARMGVDLSGVRVHQGPGAQTAAARLNARAFTHDHHIWLGRGESAGDVRLMAHEVTHVLQQDGVVRRKPARSPTDEPDSGAIAEDGKPPPPLASPAASSPAILPARAGAPSTAPSPVGAHSTAPSPADPPPAAPREASPAAEPASPDAQAAAAPEEAGGALARAAPVAAAEGQAGVPGAEAAAGAPVATGADADPGAAAQAEAELASAADAARAALTEAPDPEMPEGATPGAQLLLDALGDSAAAGREAVATAAGESIDAVIAATGEQTEGIARGGEAQVAAVSDAAGQATSQVAASAAGQAAAVEDARTVEQARIAEWESTATARAGEEVQTRATWMVETGAEQERRALQAGEAAAREVGTTLGGAAGNARGESGAGGGGQAE
ncbi:MAG TPA: DUF4157 domain-containing protein, partial [Longimicrobium sp.]